MNSLDKFKTKIIVGQVHSIDSVNGKISVSYLTEQGFKTFNVPSVFTGSGSWIRAYPEINSYVLIAETNEDQFPEIIKIFDPSEKTRYLLHDGIEVNYDTTRGTKPFDRVAQSKSTAEDEIGPIGFPYRQLQAGEIEASSNGKASWWLGSNGELVLKGGLSKIEMDPFKNSIETFSASHNLLGIDSSLENLYDQEYFGVVRRASTNESEILGSIRRTESRIAKFSNAQTNYENINNTIKTLGNKAIDNRNRLYISYSEVNDQILLPSLPFGILLDSIRTTLNTNATIYIKSLKTYRDYSASYLGSSDANIQLIDKDLDLLNTWKKDDVEKFIGEASTSRDANQENNLIKDLRGDATPTATPKAGSTKIERKNSIYLKEIPKVNIEDYVNKFQTAITNSTLDALAIKKASAETELLNNPEVKYVDSKYLYPKLQVLAKAGGEDSFAKEWRVNVSWKNSVTSDPTPLYEKIAGHVYEENGTLLRYANKELRSAERFWTDDNQQSFITVDVEGNMFSSMVGGVGYTVVAKKGNINLEAGKEFNITAGSADIGGKGTSTSTIKINGNLFFDVTGIIYMKAGGGIEERAPKITSKSQLNNVETTLNKITSTITNIEGFTTQENPPMITNLNDASNSSVGLTSPGHASTTPTPTTPPTTPEFPDTNTNTVVFDSENFK